MGLSSRNSKRYPSPTVGLVGTCFSRILKYMVMIQIHGTCIHPYGNLYTRRWVSMHPHTFQVDLHTRINTHDISVVYSSTYIYLHLTHYHKFTCVYVTHVYLYKETHKDSDTETHLISYTSFSIYGLRTLRVKSRTHESSVWTQRGSVGKIRDDEVF